MSPRVRVFFILVMTILVPNTQAVISHAGSDMALNGYYCTQPGKINMITVEYSDHVTGLPCKVEYHQNSYTSQTLLEAQRSIEACEVKAKSMSLRLLDRGWQCEGAFL